MLTQSLKLSSARLIAPIMIIYLISCDSRLRLYTGPVLFSMKYIEKVLLIVFILYVMAKRDLKIDF